MDLESLRILNRVISEGAAFHVYHTRPGRSRIKGFLKPNGTAYANFQAEDNGYYWGIGLNSSDTIRIELVEPEQSTISKTKTIIIEFDTFVSVNQNF